MYKIKWGKSPSTNCPEPLLDGEEVLIQDWVKIAKRANALEEILGLVLNAWNEDNVKTKHFDLYENARKICRKK